jgi:hypothetical protein
MKSFLGSFLVITFLVTSLPVLAQDSDSPPLLVCSFNQVPMGKVGTVNNMVDSIFTPILNGLVDEGMLMGWGQFNHTWGDEWNVNFWYTAKDMSSFDAFWSEYVKRVSEQHPGAFGETVKYFKAHKDNIYVIRKQYSAPPTE